MVIKLYVSRTPGNPVIKREQEFIKRILDCKNIYYEEVDISDPLHTGDKESMYKTLSRVVPCDEGLAIESDLITCDLPPQLFNGDKYRGDFQGFYKAVETETLYQYLALDIPPKELEYKRKRNLLNIADEYHR